MLIASFSCENKHLPVVILSSCAYSQSFEIACKWLTILNLVLIAISLSGTASRLPYRQAVLAVKYLKNSNEYYMRLEIMGWYLGRCFEELKVRNFTYRYIAELMIKPNSEDLFS